MTQLRRRRLSSLYEGPHRPTAFHAAIWWRGGAGRGEGLEKNNKQHDHHQRRRERRGLAARRVAARERGAARKGEEIKKFVRACRTCQFGDALAVKMKNARSLTFRENG